MYPYSTASIAISLFTRKHQKGKIQIIILMLRRGALSSPVTWPIAEMDPWKVGGSQGTQYISWRGQDTSPVGVQYISYRGHNICSLSHVFNLLVSLLRSQTILRADFFVKYWCMMINSLLQLFWFSLFWDQNDIEHRVCEIVLLGQNQNLPLASF